jgi:hypothetical protein
VLSGAVSVEDVEPLVGWFGEVRSPRVDLYDCRHLHGAVLQALLTHRPRLARGPRDPFLATWITPLLATPPGPRVPSDTADAAPEENDQP